MVHVPSDLQKIDAVLFLLSFDPTILYPAEQVYLTELPIYIATNQTTNDGCAYKYDMEGPWKSLN